MKRTETDILRIHIQWFSPGENVDFELERAQKKESSPPRGSNSQPSDNNYRTQGVFVKV